MVSPISVLALLLSMCNNFYEHLKQLTKWLPQATAALEAVSRNMEPTYLEQSNRFVHSLPSLAMQPSVTAQHVWLCEIVTILARKLSVMMTILCFLTDI